MSFIITIITNKDHNPLNENLVNRVFKILEKKLAKINNFSWLSVENACDIEVSDIEYDNARQILRQYSDELKFDFAITQKDNRRKKLLICDMDSTIIEQECIDEIAEILGIKDKVAAITEAAMNGKIEFASALKERVALLKDIKEDTLEQVYSEKITLMPGAAALVATMNKYGAKTILVSGGFTLFTNKIAHRIGFNENHANILEIKNGKLTGRVIEPILDKSSKLEILQNLIEKYGLAKEDTIAVGDGANDLPMLKYAGIGVAFRAKEIVRQETQFHINYTDLTSLLYIQGFKLGEITDAS